MHPVLFTLFGRTLYSYQATALAGAGALFLTVFLLSRCRRTDRSELLYTGLCAAGGVVVGGALLYALTQLPAFFSIASGIGWDELFRQPARFVSLLSELFGGLVFYGGLLGGLAGGCIYLRACRLEMREYADVFTPAIPLFHAFGRVGCFFSGCCYGIEHAGGVTFTESIAPGANGVPRLPVQLIEAGGELLLFALLLALFLRGVLRGQLLWLYLTLYPVLRFSLEFLRGDAYRGFLLGLSTSQWISLALLLASGLHFLRAALRRRARGAASC